MTAREQLPDVLGGKPKGASDINTRTHTITFFKDKFASRQSFANLTLPHLAKGMSKGVGRSKLELPWLKLAVFGTKRTDKHCLRHNANVVEISGIEGEHDAGTMSFDAAVMAMRAANIRCLLYTSPSYEPVTKEKWRVLVPLSKNHPPDKHAGMVSRVNGLLGGVFTPECFTLSQAYLFGRVAGREHRVEVIDGDFIDQRDDTIAEQIGKGGRTGPRAEWSSSGPDSRNPQPVERWRVEAALAVINPNCKYSDWLAVAGGLYRSFGDNGFELFDQWSAKATGPATDGTPMYTAEKSRERWRGARTLKQFTAGTIFWLADLADPGWRDHKLDLSALRRASAQASNETGGAAQEQASAGAGDGAQQGQAGTEHADPVDLWAKFDPPPLPRGLLPKLIEDFAFDQGRLLGADEAGIALGALVVCGAAIPDRIRLQPKQHDQNWLEEARIWGALIGPVSGMKTPIISTVARPLRVVDTDMARSNQRAMAEYNKLPKEEKRQTQVPPQPQLVLQDTTIEAAQEVMKDSPDGVLCLRDELSGWFGSMDKYAGARGSASDRAFWLQAYNGGPYTINRIGRGSAVIPNLSACILGGIQPEPIRKLAADSVDDGLLQRLIPVVLRPAVAGRDERRGGDEYSGLIGRLRRIGITFLGGGTFMGGETLHFDAGAMAIREELEKKHLELQQCESIHRKLAAHIGKYNGIFARLCVIWHCVEHVGGNIPANVTEDIARRVRDFLHDFLLPHALAFYAGTLGLSNDHDRLAAVAGFILARKLDRVTNRHITRGDGTMRDLKRRDTDAIFEQLDALGWVTQVPGPRPSSPSHWVVNPAVHQKFAEKAKAEADRRERERTMIGKMMRGWRR